MNKVAANVPDGASCFTCERFIGAADTCPYCGEGSAKSPMLRILRFIALGLAVVGLGLLYLASGIDGFPVTKIGLITPAMNFAQIRVVGNVRRDAYVAREAGEVDYLSFYLDDGSGEIQVRAYRTVARALVENGAVPNKGERVGVIGNLRVPAGKKPRLTLQSEQQLHIERNHADSD